MPAKRRSRKRRSSKRKGRSMSKGYSSKLTVARLPKFYIPDRTIAKLSYIDTKTHTPTTTPSQNVYNGNFIYDPDNTGTGHQPFYFDQMTPLYEKFMVRGCKIQIQVTAATNAIPYFVQISATKDAGLVADVTTDMERPNVITKISSGSAPNVRLSMYRSTKKIAGPHGIDDLTHGNDTTPPVFQWYYLIRTQAADLGTATTLYVTTRLTYYIMASQRIKVAQS